MSVVAIATLAVGGVAVADHTIDDNDKNKAKYDSEVTLNYNSGPYDPYDPYYEEAVFKGRVKATPANKAARKHDNGDEKCEKKRTVIIKNLDKPRGERVFTTTFTNREGKYRADASDAEPGTYRAKVTKKRKVRAEIKCFGANSNTVEVENQYSE